MAFNNKCMRQNPQLKILIRILNAIHMHVLLHYSVFLFISHKNYNLLMHSIYVYIMNSGAKYIHIYIHANQGLPYKAVERCSTALLFQKSLMWLKML